MNKLISAIVCSMILGSALWADPDQTPPPVVGETGKSVTFTTKDGKTYTNAKVSVTDTGLSVLTSDGGGSVDFAQIPDDISVFSDAIQTQIKARRSAGSAVAPSVGSTGMIVTTAQTQVLEAAQTSSDAGPNAASACARLGESEDEIVKRHPNDNLQPRKSFAWYGSNRTSLKVDVITFSYSGFNVRVTCMKGISCEIAFNKMGTGMLGVDEADILLTANAQGHIWKRLNNPKTRTDRNGITYYYDEAKWLRDDNATASISGNFCRVTSDDLPQAEASAYNADRSENLEGF